MLYRSCTPSSPLGGFVERLWLCSDAPAHPTERILPSGTIELVINLRDDEIRVYDPTSPGGCRRFSGAVVSGAYSRSFAIDPLVHASILGVHFRPGGASPFLGVPAGEVADMHLDLETLWGPAAVELRERLCEAATPTERFTLVEEALLARLDRRPDRHPAVPAALELFVSPEEPVQVRDVVRCVGLSHRRFIQVFAAEVGMTPKRYSRVLRFQRALEIVRHLPAPDWARVAVECGYFDQSHLIRDFQELSGTSPVELHHHRGKRLLPNHLPQLR